MDTSVGVLHHWDTLQPFLCVPVAVGLLLSGACGCLEGGVEVAWKLDRVVRYRQLQEFLCMHRVQYAGVHILFANTSLSKRVTHISPHRPALLFTKQKSKGPPA